MSHIIYKYTSPSGKSYIGQTCNLDRRVKRHKSKFNPCVAFARAIEKYGYENFSLEILEENLTLDEANVLEELYIEQYDTLSPNGYNLQSGGFSRLQSQESKDKQSAKMKGRKQSEERKRKQSENFSGINHPRYGKKGKNSGTSKIYIITFPDEHEEKILCLKEFCENNNLTATVMSQLAKKNPKRYHHKGFKCRYYEEVNQ